MKKLKLSVIGTSWITNSFLEGAALIENFVFDGVYSRTKERGKEFAKANGMTRHFTLLDELCQSDTDCVYVASPNAFHYEHCLALLQNGKHVLCEKPITVSLSQYLTLQKIALESSLVFIEAIMYMHTPARAALIKALSSIGKVHSASFDFSQLSSKYPALMRGENPNIFNPLLKTGALNDLGVYCVYPAIDLFSYPEKITTTHHHIFTGADGCGSSFFEYPDKLVTLTYSKVGQSHGVSQIFGDKGTIAIKSISQLTDISLFDNDGNENIIFGDMTKKELMGHQAKSFYEFIVEPDKNKSRLTLCQNQAESVVRAMDEMRKGYSISISQ